MYKENFPTFKTNDVQDTYIFYPAKKFPDWQTDFATLVDDGGPFTTPVVPTIRNNMIDFAYSKGYEVLWIVDDDITNFYRFHDEQSDDKPLQKDRKTPLPEVEELFGGIIGANFKRFKLKTGKKYSNQIPYSCMYLNLKMYKEKGIKPQFEVGVETWDDFDFALQMRQKGFLPQTFNQYAIIKTGTQDSETVGKSLAAAGIDKVNKLGFELYKKWGHANTAIKLKVNIIDVAPALCKTFQPKFWTYRIDSYENWKVDVLNNTAAHRKSDKAKKEGLHV